MALFAAGTRLGPSIASLGIIFEKDTQGISLGSIRRGESRVSLSGFHAGQTSEVFTARMTSCFSSL